MPLHVLEQEMLKHRTRVILHDSLNEHSVNDTIQMTPLCSCRWLPCNVQSPFDSTVYFRLTALYSTVFLTGRVAQKSKKSWTLNSSKI